MKLKNTILILACLVLFIASCNKDDASCTDGILNGNETGIDCGGICISCPTCNDGIMNGNETGIDCGGNCTACISCNDNIQNGNETGVDCGGDCDPCPTCEDGMMNGNETGIDCGGDCLPCYSIGEIGPGLGLVFYDKGNYGDGWRYMEAHAQEIQGNLDWGCDITLVDGTAFFIGFGKSNTDRILQKLGNGCSTAPAAKACDVFISNGFSDWYLPSVDELKAMFSLRNELNLTNAGRHWSSTESNFEDAWIVDFNAASVDASSYTFFKNGSQGTARVRPVRRF